MSRRVGSCTSCMHSCMLNTFASLLVPSTAGLGLQPPCQRPGAAGGREQLEAHYQGRGAKAALRRSMALQGRRDEGWRAHPRQHRPAGAGGDRQVLPFCLPQGSIDQEGCAAMLARTPLASLPNAQAQPARRRFVLSRACLTVGRAELLAASSGRMRSRRRTWPRRRSRSRWTRG